MNFIARLAQHFSARSRGARAAVFRECFDLVAGTRLLDLGSESGANINLVLSGSAVEAKDVYIADIDAEAIRRGADRYGYIPVLIDETARIPFPDGFFDIVYCSSVIEHVTVPKSRIWAERSGVEFRRQAARRQEEFAKEIARVGKQYFVQTPYKYFPFESHSWLPFLGWLPRRILLPVLRFTNAIWVKRTSPDWHLLNRTEMSRLFPAAAIHHESCFYLTKSIMAVYSLRERKEERKRGRARWRFASSGS